MDKYEYLTGEDLGLKPNTIEKGGKQLKELKNIDKSKTLKAIDEISKKNFEANILVPKFKKLDKELENVELVCTKTDGTKNDFNRFSLP